MGSKETKPLQVVYEQSIYDTRFADQNGTMLRPKMYVNAINDYIRRHGGVITVPSVVYTFLRCWNVLSHADLVQVTGCYEDKKSLSVRLKFIEAPNFQGTVSLKELLECYGLKLIVLYSTTWTPGKSIRKVSGSIMVNSIVIDFDRVRFLNQCLGRTPVVE